MEEKKNSFISKEIFCPRFEAVKFHWLQPKWYNVELELCLHPITQLLHHSSFLCYILSCFTLEYRQLCYNFLYESTEGLPYQFLFLPLCLDVPKISKSLPCMTKKRHFTWCMPVQWILTLLHLLLRPIMVAALPFPISLLFWRKKTSMLSFDQKKVNHFSCSA